MSQSKNFLEETNPGDNELEIMEISISKINEVKERILRRDLEESDYEIIEGCINGYLELARELSEKRISITRLKKIFGKQTERKESILKEKDVPEPKGFDENDHINEGLKTERDFPGKVLEPKKGHGKNGMSAYEQTQRIDVELKGLKLEDKCPECEGKLYGWKEGIVLRITGNPLLQATSYHIKKLRCSECQKIYQPELPAQAGDKKYDESAQAVIATLKYGMGMPFYRMAGFQLNQGVPLPASTQWDIVRGLREIVFPLYYAMMVEGAQGELFHNDDTPVRILDLMNENGANPEKVEKEKKGIIKRKGMHTTGILSQSNGHVIALYFSGRKHAGENLTELLMNRLMKLETPIQMCDALSRNTSQEFTTILCNCLVHGRRNFVDILNDFPKSSTYVITELGKVYRNEKDTNSAKMTSQQRLEYHQEKSGPIMEALHQWFIEQFEKKNVEPNSSLGKAIHYMNKHWKKLTLFLRVAGAPLDNNAVERILKMAILNRKNAYFYKSQDGADVGDVFMSIIQTCKLCGANAIHYLTEIQKNTQDAWTNPEEWLPWNYKQALAGKKLE